MDSESVKKEVGEIETFKNSWSLRELDRQYNSALFTRLSLSKDKNEILKLDKKFSL